MKKVSLFLIAVFALGLTGCSKDAEINAFIAEFEGVTKEIVSKIDASPNEAGVDAAQKAFDAKKASLKDKWNAIKDAVGFQVSADVKKKLEDSVKANTQSLVDMSVKHGMALATDDGAMPKFEKLMKDYQSTFDTK